MYIVQYIYIHVPCWSAPCPCGRGWSPGSGGPDKCRTEPQSVTKHKNSTLKGLCHEIVHSCLIFFYNLRYFLCTVTYDLSPLKKMGVKSRVTLSLQKVSTHILSLAIEETSTSWASLIKHFLYWHFRYLSVKVL